MSISVYIGHTGQRFALDPSVTNTVDALRTWITSQTSIQPRNQILLTAHGKQVRAQTLLTENELFVFDSSWLGGKNPNSPVKEPLDDRSNSDFKPGPAPDTITNQNDLQSWGDLFRARKSWAAGLFNGCSVKAKQADQYAQEKEVIQRSLSVAVASLQQHVKNAEKQYNSSESWSDELIQEQAAHVSQWEANLNSLRDVPSRMDFVRFIDTVGGSATSRRLSQQANTATLQGFVDVAGIRKAAAQAKTTLNSFSNRITKMREDLDSAATNSNDLLRLVEQISNRSIVESVSEPTQLIEEIGMVVKKMNSDLEHVESLPRTQQSVSQASKMALLHTRNYLPNLGDYCNEMNELMHRNKQQRDAAADLTLEHMRTLSSIESQLATLYADLKNLEMPEDQHQAFVTLSAVSRLPSVYGQLLVESVRRREWVAKMKRDTSTLQEEVATYQEEEEKRRKKWIRTVEDVVSPEALHSRVLGVELNLQNQGDSWPVITREEVNDYLKVLLEVYGEGPVTNEITQAIRDLDKPTRKQIKHAKAFKNGSIHEAAFGDTSLLLRGDDQNKTLREMNTRLEEDLKAQRSRVRKLEDLLYRQTQMSRASTGDVFAPYADAPSLLQRPGTSPRAPTPQLADDARNRPRGLSTTPAPNQEEKRLAKRIVDLEAEVESYKNEVSTRKNSDAAVQKQVEEALLTKRDLMQNMEAQQREFVDERRNLERDLSEAREKAEELENELERILGSRDGADDEIARLKEDAAGHAARAATAQDAQVNLQSKLDQSESARARADEEVKQLRAELDRRRQAETEPLQMLTTAHAQLARNDNPPTDLLGIATALEELARKSAAHAKDLEEAVTFAKSENESLWSSNERQKRELSETSQRQANAEEQVRHAEEKLREQEAKVISLTEQLNEEQEQLRLLRTKFAEGETGSDILRQRVAEEEAQVRSLTSQLAEAKSHVNSLDVELMRLQRKQRSDHETADGASERLQKQAERAKDVSQKLYSYNARLGRLIERLGLAVSYQDGSMIIERASKMAASMIMSEMPSRKGSLDSPPPNRPVLQIEPPEPPLDLNILHWPDASTLSEELARYVSFTNHISRFDLDVFADAVTKRVKDFEYTAKKYSKEAKESSKRADAYKDRALKLRSEVHAKLAVRDFKEGDLALFLPTRGGQVKGAWAAFNIGCPHHFLAEREGMRLGTRDFIVARIQRVEQKVVDLTSPSPPPPPQQQLSPSSSRSRGVVPPAAENDNPFDLSDGLTWWLVHATEERGILTGIAPSSSPSSHTVASGAPTTPGLGKSTVAAANVDAKGSIRIKRSGASGAGGVAGKGGEQLLSDASRHLNKSLDSRRSSSSASVKKGMLGGGGGGGGGGGPRSPGVEGTGTGALSPVHGGGGGGLGILRPSSLGGSQRSAASTEQVPPVVIVGNGGAAQVQVQAQGLGAGERGGGDNRDQILSLSRAAPGAAAAVAPALNTPTTTTMGGSGGEGTKFRAQSPSKSVKSLMRHLEGGSDGGNHHLAAKAESGGGGSKQKAGWESLWSAEFAVESSPSKKKE